MVGNGIQVQIETIGVVEFKLEIGYIFVLNGATYVSSFRRNLISISTMDQVIYYFAISNESLNLVLNSVIVGVALLCDVLYKLNFSSMTASLNVENVDAKITMIKENSSTLWHRRLAHISKKIIE